jgi:DNA helicase-2/ATP-dependent DNA helicase PcrA
MEYVKENIIISTIHGAKGLEWDYVFMPDMEQYSMPSWNGLCKDCNYKRNCDLIVDERNETKFIEQLSVFYVGVTRAKRQVFFSASKTRLKANGSIESVNLSCLLKLSGIVLIERA